MTEENEEKVYPAEEQGIEKEETKEEVKQDISTGDKEADVYTEEGREQLVEDGELSIEEEAFMEGEEKEELGACLQCGKVLGDDKTKVIEKEFHDNVFWFCSDSCLKEFEKQEEHDEFPVEEEPEEEVEEQSEEPAEEEQSSEEPVDDSQEKVE